MEATIHSDPQVFWELASPLYLADPARNTTAITAIQRCLAGGALGYANPTMLTIRHEGAVIGAALRTPPHRLIVGALPALAMSVAIDALREHDANLSGVIGPRGDAEAFAAAWCVDTDLKVREEAALRAFELEKLIPPRVPGKARIAAESDFSLLIGWGRAFAEEALGSAHEDVENSLRASFALGQPGLLWERGGVPVSMARASKPVAGMSRIGPVYTPPTLRGFGYGSAATAAASQWALDAGAATVLLFTDLKNPISNHIYPKLGYQEIYDAAVLDFIE